MVDCVFVLLESELEECFEGAFSCGEKYVADCLVAVLIDCGTVFCRCGAAEYAHCHIAGCLLFV